MYRYIIVDDEVLIRKGLISKINDITSIPITCAGEAANGIEGLALIEAQDPDIIITDMKMTKMDGMEFLEKIAERYPDKPIIVISGYKAFDYVSKAIEKKAVGYVLKPFSTEEIEKQLAKAAAQIEQQKNLIQLEEKVAFFELKQEQDVLLQALLEPWNDTTEEALSSRNYNLQSYNLLISVNSKDRECICKAKEICREHLNDINYIILENPTNKYQYFILMETAREDLREKMEAKAQHIARYLEKATPAGKLFIFLSDPVRGFEKLNRCYQLNERLERQIFLNDRVRILPAKAISEQKGMAYSEDHMKNLFRRLKYQSQNTKELLDDFFNGMDLSKHTLGVIGNTCENLINKVNDYAVQNNTETDDIMSVFYRRYMFQSSLEKMQKEISGYVILILNSIRMASQESDLLFDRIQEYILNNYHRKLTLQVLASQFYIPSASCSSLIKEKLNMSFNEYLADIRLEKAKQLLQETDLSAERISDEIGYSNPKYFFKIFKKMTNLTPVEYRNQYR